ncbi:MAG: hypothetical protein VW683_17580, partial [Betaproteobacteria bacterium]
GDPNDVQIDFENDQIILKTGGAPRVNITNTEVSSSGISRIITLSASADAYVSGAVSASVFYGVGTGITGIPSTGITPAGSDNEIQFNNGGVMGASANLTWTDTHLFVSGTTVLSGTLLTHDILPIIDEQYSIGTDILRYENAYLNYMNGGVAFVAVNDEGVAITKGQVVYIKGISGGTPTVALAACDVPAKMPAFGFVADGTINQGAQGRIVTMGRLNGIDTSTFSEGNILYVQTGSNGTSGSFTATRPTGSNNLLQNIGKVTEAAASGQIRAGGAGRTNATPNLDKGYLFVGNDSDCSVQDNTIYVSSSANRVGINTIPLDSTLEVNGTTAVSGNVNIRLNNQFFQGYSTANANVSLIGVYSDDVIHVGNLGYDISLRDDTFVQGNISGSGTAQFVGATVLGNDLSVSGSTIMESLTANGITNVGAYSGSSTLHVDGNATIGSDVLASGSISASVGLSAGTFISSSLGIHVTGSQPHIAIGDKFGGAALDGMLAIRPSDTSNKTLALMQAAEADGGRIALGVSGSGQITVGG